MKSSQMRKAKAIYVELDRAKDSTTITCILTETEKQVEEWESFVVKKRGGFMFALIGGRWQRNL